MEETDSQITAESITKSLLAGGVAAMCAKTVVAPLDRIKILLQAQNVHYKDSGVLRGLQRIVVKENTAALFRSNGAQMARVFPQGALQFACYEILKRTIPLVTTYRRQDHNLKFVCGSLAGLISVTATYPLDSIRSRLANQVAGQDKYRGIVQTGQLIFRTEGGLRGLYRGLTPTLIGIIPYSGLAFYFFELNKSLVVTYCQWARVTESDGSVRVSLTARLLCSGMAGAFSQTVSYPLDVVRRRMQVGGLEGGMMKVFWTTYQEAGVVRGLFRGMTVNYMRAIPQTAVLFSVYETMKQWMGVQTGIKMSSI